MAPMARPGDEGGITACSRTLRTELLSVADADELIGLSDRCLQGCEGWRPPEPVVGERFLLTDVLATRAQVHHRGQVGWAMRVGDAPAATLAAAICDAEAESGTGLAEAVEELCWATARAREIEDAAEWAELAATEVRFEELT